MCGRIIFLSTNVFSLFIVDLAHAIFQLIIARSSVHINCNNLTEEFMLTHIEFLLKAVLAESILV